MVKMQQIHKEKLKDLLRLVKRSYNIKSLFAIKPLEVFIKEREKRPEGRRLAESLNLIDLLGYGVGCTIGSGIYSLVGIGAGIAGTAIVM